ncbi:SRPBCC domain-containing protein [Cellulomonas fengjieae]|uniref:SRPBCC domain-containing protein n=1 Tax=Cellulomonas fengjieae TaxID=2819978 RepID=A0ABS3SI13_9CELL|nr:SRPBCC domain-containing protein [Cellulomonas fengjieae]MBO3085393.1 SRPBCC domain-containing protein [Cellulomonas fengjieae]QVI66055.1 SRPBCC domain-containing protein [Cellulomonas fengjieae]
MPLSRLSTRPGALTLTWSFSAPMEDVWVGLTDPALVAQWLGRPTQYDVRLGGALVVDHGDGFLSRSVVTELEPARRLAMTWDFPDEPASVVGFTLRPSGAGTVLELAHDGLGELVAAYGPGWVTHLTYLEAAVAGAPIPRAQFWALHATFELLHAGAAR